MNVVLAAVVGGEYERDPAPIQAPKMEEGTATESRQNLLSATIGFVKVSYVLYI